MKGNKAETTFASNKIASSKWLLLACAVSAAAVDLVIIIMLALGGTDGMYLACPCLLLIFDVIYFAVSLFFTNFRFKYSLGVWISYVFLFTVGMIIGSSILLGGYGTVITTGAIGMWAGVHTFNIICAVICALYASRVMKNRWVAYVLAAIYFAGCVLYAVFTCTYGFFGQGTQSRTLVYDYRSETDDYVAITALSGRSEEVDIPLTFNDKPVGAVSAAMFLARGVNSFTIHEDVQLVMPEGLTNVDLDFSGKSIFVEKDAANAVRSSLFAFTQSDEERVAQNAVTLANAVTPVNLAEGEGYVKFNYDLNAYNKCNGKILPIYAGDLQNFDFAKYSQGFDYVTHGDKNNADDLDWAYAHGGYVLSDIKSGNSSLLKNGKVGGDTVADVSFEKVYRITVNNGNDLQYKERERQPEFCHDTISGVAKDFKYLAESNAQSYLNSFKGRKGFDISWAYKNERGYYSILTDLPETLKGLGEGSDLTILPEWELKAPVVKLTTNSKNNTFTYGEDVEFTCEAQIEAEGLPFTYYWPDYSANGAVYKLQHPEPFMSGNYDVEVRVGGNSVTSLKASAYAETDIVINKKPVTFKWSYEDASGANLQTLTYDAENKYVVPDFDRNQLVGTDTINYKIYGLNGADYESLYNRGSVLNAGTYTYMLNVSGSDASNYNFSNTEHSVTVNKRAVQLTWSNYEGLMYNGTTQSPQASATGVGSDGELVSSVTGGSRNAGAHTARAVATASASVNYTFTNPTRSYAIAKAPLTVKPANLTLTYGLEPTPDIINLEYDGFVGGDTSLALNANGMTCDFSEEVIANGCGVSTYTGGVIIKNLNSSNYDITYLSGDVEIVQLQAVLAWQNDMGLTYNTTAKNVTARVKNAVYGDELTVTVTGGNAVDAGTHTARAVSISGEKAANYRFVPDEHSYVIQPAKITITPVNLQQEYGEPEKTLQAKVTSGINYNNEVKYTLSREAGKNVGEYDITVNVDSASANNYTVTCNTGTYEIIRRMAGGSWSRVEGMSYVYDGSEKHINYGVERVLAEDLKYVTYEGTTSAYAAGKYTVRIKLDPAIAGNYSLSNASCTWDIEKGESTLQVKVNGVEITEDTGIVNSPNATVEWLTTDSENVTVQVGNASYSGTEYTVQEGESTVIIITAQVSGNRKGKTIRLEFTTSAEG